MKRHLEPIPGAGAGPMFNQILNGRFGDVLTRMFWIRSAGAPAPTLSPEIQAGFEVNAQDNADVFYLRNERLCAGAATRGPPGAGNTAKCILQNPVGSGISATVLGMTYWTDLAGDLYVWLIPLSFAPALGVSRNLDRRYTNIATVCSVGTIADASTVPPAASLGVFYRFPLVVGLNQAVNIPIAPGIVMTPGSQLVIGHNLAVTPNLYTTFQWRERALTAEELGTG